MTDVDLVTAAATPPRLELRGITKRYGNGTLANDDIWLSVGAGEIHALLGENGAGKSTLVKIIDGVLQADAGEILWDGVPIEIGDPRAARRLGIGMVFQHFSLFEAMTVEENVALGLARPGDRRTLARRIAEGSRGYGLALDPGRAVHTLSVGERQRVEIVRCLLEVPRLLIMDEPTSVLTPQEAQLLFQTLRRVAAEGCSILYISHKLGEIRALCERATILRGGRVVTEVDPRTTSARSLAGLMLGGELPPSRSARGPLDAGLAAETGPAAETGHVPRFSVTGLDLPAADGTGTSLHGIGFAVDAGEILGIAGVAGNGQSELAEALSGERLAPRAEAIRLDGEPIGLLDAGARRLVGLCGIPENRIGHAAVGGMSLAENAILSAHHRAGLASGGVLRPAKARRFAGEIVRRFDVRTAGAQASASSLSGGNLQKFVVGREILQEPLVLVAAQPTWGVDAGAAAAIHAALVALADRGAAIVVISQDLDELLELTDRIAVLDRGRLSRPIATRDATADGLGLLMGGVHETAAP